MARSRTTRDGRIHCAFHGDTLTYCGRPAKERRVVQGRFLGLKILWRGPRVFMSSGYMGGAMHRRCQTCVRAAARTWVEARIAHPKEAAR